MKMRDVKPVLEGTLPAEVSEAALDACLTFVLASRELIHCVGFEELPALRWVRLALLARYAMISVPILPVLTFAATSRPWLWSPIVLVAAFVTWVSIALCAWNLRARAPYRQVKFRAGDPAVEVFGGPEGSVFVPAKLAIRRRWLWLTPYHLLTLDVLGQGLPGLARLRIAQGRRRDKVVILQQWFGQMCSGQGGPYRAGLPSS